jgi:hypothetical protein
MVSNYKDNFSQAGDNIPESVFEVQFAPGLQSGEKWVCNRAKFMVLRPMVFRWAMLIRCKIALR